MYAFEELAVLMGLGVIGGGLGALVVGGLAVGGMALYNYCKKKDPESEISIKYQASLPQLIQEQQEKLDKLYSELKKLQAELKQKS